MGFSASDVEDWALSKNVLVISGSPRRGGNSDLLCDRFVQGARDAGHTAEKVFLRDKRVGVCLACDSCRGTGVCVQNDDMAELLRKMGDADAVVLATPVYFYSMNAQVKTLIDRTYSYYTQLGDKDYYVIMTAAAGSRGALDRTLEGFRGFFDCVPGARERGVVYGTGAWGRGDIETSVTMDQAYDMGRSV